MQKVLGATLLIVGALLMMIALTMDTTVQVGGSDAKIVGTTYGTEYLPATPSMQVHNMGLMQRQQNLLIVGSVSGIAGLLMLLLGRSQPVQAPASDVPLSEELQTLGIKMVGEKFVVPTGQEFSSAEAAVLFARSRA